MKKNEDLTKEMADLRLRTSNASTEERYIHKESIARVRYILDSRWWMKKFVHKKFYHRSKVKDALSVKKPKVSLRTWIESCLSRWKIWFQSFAAKGKNPVAPFCGVCMALSDREDKFHQGTQRSNCLTIYTKATERRRGNSVAQFYGITKITMAMRGIVVDYFTRTYSKKILFHSLAK